MDKELYRQNREAGIRGQGAYIPTATLIKQSAIKVIGSIKDGKTQRLAMNRTERRRIGLDVNRLEQR